MPAKVINDNLCSRSELVNFDNLLADFMRFECTERPCIFRTYVPITHSKLYVQGAICKNVLTIGRNPAEDVESLGPRKEAASKSETTFVQSNHHQRDLDKVSEALNGPCTYR